MPNFITSTQSEWLKCLNDKLPYYLQTLERPGQPGRFLPCAAGVTEVGEQIALGFSCFALKLYSMLGLWPTLAAHQQAAWITFLNSFQQIEREGLNEGAFIDPALIRYLAAQTSWSRRLIKTVFRPKQPTQVQMVIFAETKQAIATLAEVGETSLQPFSSFPRTPAEVKHHLDSLDWTAPWGAGGQASALIVFLKIEAPRLLEVALVQPLLDICIQFLANLADPNTGGYFKGEVPEHGQLINGAMKVLTALDWLDVPIHYPEQLIDTCLERLPSSEGCHLVDAVYVLYRCLQQTDYQKSAVQAYCNQVLDMIGQHHQPDGGFSYFLNHSQITYYGVPISEGLALSDIHGTCLLTWALAMILEILESNLISWQVIKP